MTTPPVSGHPHHGVTEDRFRGLMLGLLLGDAYDELDGPGPVRGTCLGHLACFSAEGMIRASVRAAHKGICHPPSVVWHAWCRWGHVQGIAGDTFAQAWGPGSWGSWPDGWLWQVRPLAERRGSAPATVAALRASAQFPQRPAGTSAGHHAATRTLPLAMYARPGHVEWVAEVAADLAAATHGDPSARTAAARAVVEVAGLLNGTTDTGPDRGVAGAAGRGTAWHAPVHGRAAAASAPDLPSALASAAPHGRGAATAAGAMYGAAHGVRGLPADLVQRLEIGWVADRLARDTYADITARPGGSAYEPASDPTWWARYPGW